VTSEIGRGTTVHVFLPVPTASSARSGGTGERAGADVAVGTSRRDTILVVDDEPLVREVAEVFLRSEGFGVVSARDGREARHLIEGRDDIGAVILDLSLPDVGVEEILDLIRHRRPGLPVILSSGHYEEISDRAVQRDVVTFLLKPWELSRLLVVVEQALSRKP
jgi:DNA-binding NtrC family response regulator